jgi:hydrogenase expression/formation protein HypE
VIVVDAACAARALEALRGHPLGREAVGAGRIVGDPAGRVVLRTSIGGMRIVEVPSGEQLPRIC